VRETVPADTELGVDAKTVRRTATPVVPAATVHADASELVTVKELAESTDATDRTPAHVPVKVMLCPTEKPCAARTPPVEPVMTVNVYARVEPALAIE